MDAHIPKGILWGAVNFGIFVYLLKYLLKMPLKDFFASRRVRLTKATTESEHLLNGAERLFKEADEKRINVSAEAEKITELLTKEGISEGRQIVENAREHAARLKREIGKSAERDEKRMRERLSDETSRLVLGAAQKKIKERMNIHIDERIKSNFVERLKGL